MALVNTPKAENNLTTTDVGDSICPRGHFTVSIGGTFTGSVTLYRKLGDSGTPGEVAVYTAPAEEKGFEPASGFHYYLEADLSAGSADVIIGDQKVR